MADWGDDDDEILHAPRRYRGGKPYDPIATFRGELAVIGEDLEAVAKKVASYDAHLRTLKWAVGLTLVSALGSGGTLVYTIWENKRDAAENARAIARHEAEPVHTRAIEGLADVREALGEVRVELRESRSATNERLTAIEKRLEKRR